MKLIAMFALLAIAVACAKEEAAPATGDTGSGDTGKSPAGMTKTVDDMKKAAEDAGAPSTEMRTVTLSIEGMS